MAVSPSFLTRTVLLLSFGPAETAEHKEREHSGGSREMMHALANILLRKYHCPCLVDRVPRCPFISLWDGAGVQPSDSLLQVAEHLPHTHLALSPSCSSSTSVPPQILYSFIDRISAGLQGSQLATSPTADVDSV